MTPSHRVLIALSAIALTIMTAPTGAIAASGLPGHAVTSHVIADGGPRCCGLN